MDGKKISFGFMKTKKADKLVVEEKRDFIECVEEKSIKVVGGDEVKEITPLIIPMKPNTLATSERLKEIAEQVESALEEPETLENPVDPVDIPAENETLDQMVVRELLQDAKKVVKTDVPMLTVPLPAKPVNEGEKEATLDDYEAVPIQDFGLAMLRGMGWTPNKDTSKYKPPQLRPKGLGLGADKVVKGKQKQKATKDGKEEELNIVKNAYVKITNGKYAGYYGKVLSLDEDNGRVMVDIAVKKETVSLSEFMLHPVTKSEFDKESKVINADSFQEYKKRETTRKSVKADKERSPRKSMGGSEREDVSKASSSKSDSKVDKGRSGKNGRELNKHIDREKDRDRSHRNKTRDSSDERQSRRKNKRGSSNESLDSLSDKEKTQKKDRKRHSSTDSSSLSDSNTRRNKKKDRIRDSSDSDSESDYKSKKNKYSHKRDIDKKRKGKKKKRDRDRSPNYRKHKK